MTPVLTGPPGFGPDVEAEIVLSRDTFSIRYDMDRQTGVISRRGHALEGQSLAGRIDSTGRQSHQPRSRTRVGKADGFLANDPLGSSDMEP